MFRVKICGIRSRNDVQAVADAGADAVGLNFFPPSVRYVDPTADATAELAGAAREAGLMTIGLFVNESPHTVMDVAERLALNAVQLHGDEPLDTAREITGAGVSVVRAIKLPWTPLSNSQIEAATTPWSDAGCHLLLDADAGAAHGGSGRRLDWDSVRRWAESSQCEQWTLAGGLKPENVAEAVSRTSARSVDVASGVECPKGVKNDARIRAFVTNSGLV